MKAFQRVRSVAVPYPVANVDTDQILPMPFLQKPRANNFGDYLFHVIRRDEQGRMRSDFVFNHPRYAQAAILVAQHNFGCGSSREHAVWALYDAWFRVVIAPSFGDIFYGNALKNGLLPIRLPAQTISELLALLVSSPDVLLEVDLAGQQVLVPGLSSLPFDIDPFSRNCLLHGMDELDYTLSLEPVIVEFEKSMPALASLTGVTAHPV